jgi:hypothetical protein
MGRGLAMKELRSFTGTNVESSLFHEQSLTIPPAQQVDFETTKGSDQNIVEVLFDTPSNRFCIIFPSSKVSLQDFLFMETGQLTIQSRGEPSCKPYVSSVVELSNLVHRKPIQAAGYVKSV